MGRLATIHWNDPAGAAGDDLAGLAAQLLVLRGEPFRLARFSYGDELTLHFGELRPARSPRLGGLEYGSLILGVRGSDWDRKSDGDDLLVIAGPVASAARVSPDRPPTRDDLEAGAFLNAGAIVKEARPFVDQGVGAFGLRLRMADGSSLTVFPTRSGLDEPEDDGRPELADWELSTPRGHLAAGPGLVWAYRGRSAVDR